MSLLLLRDLPKFDTLRCQAERYGDGDPSVCEVTLVMLRVASDVIEAIEEQLGRYGLSQGRFTVLMLLNREPEAWLAPSAIAERAGVTRATMTGLLGGLEEDGLIQRCKCPEDARSWRIRLTKKGRRKLDGMLPEYYERMTAMVGGLSGADRKKLVELLGKVAKGVPAMRR